MPEIRVLTQYCKGCGLCVEACPRKILSLSEKFNVRGIHVVQVKIDIECTGCGSCTIMCPDAALEIRILPPAPCRPST